jgi:hypothetical protein
MSSLKILVAAASLAAFCAPAALAQQTQPDGPAPHQWHKPNPEEMAAWHARMCNDRYAHEAGRLAFLQASLSLTDAQRGPFDQWRDAVLEQSKAHSQACLAHTAMPGHFPDALERSAHEQKRLETKLAALRTERPALEAFYNSLTPDQKKQFDHEGGGHHHGHGMRMGEHRDGHEHEHG